MNRSTSAVLLRCMILVFILLVSRSTALAQVAALIRVETSPDGTGSVVPAQSIAADSSLTIFAVARDTSGNYVGNVSAAWSLQGNAGGVTEADLAASPDGRSATFTGHRVGTTAIQADSGSLPSTPSGTLTVVAGPPAKMVVVSGNNQSGQVNAVLDPLVVQVTDTYDNPVVSAAVTYRITSAPSGGGGSLSPPIADTGADGQARSTLTLGTKVGSYVVTAALSGLSVSFTESATAGPKDNVQVETQADGLGTVVPAQSIAAGDSVRGYAIARDASGNFIDNIAADTWALVNVSGDVQQSDLHVAGDRKSAWFVGNRTGSAAMEASASGLKSDPSNVIAVIPGEPSALAFGQQPGNAQVNQTISPPVTVRILDAHGNLVASASNSVTISIANNPPPGGTLSGTASVTASAGVATFSDLRINHSGTGYTLRAASGGLTQAISNPFNITVGAPATIVLVSGDGQSGTVTAAVANPLVVRVTDAGNNPVSGVQVTFAVDSLPSGAIGQGVNPSHAATDGSGLASTSLTLGNRTGTYRVSATVSGLSGSPVLFRATATAGAPAALAFGQQPSNAAAGAAISPPVTVRILDGNGNLVTAGSYSVTLSIANNPSGGTLSGTRTVSSSSGIASFNDLSINRAGNEYTLGAASGSLAQAISTPFNILTGSAATIAPSSGDNQSGTVGAQLSNPLVVTVRDAAGNGVSGVTVVFAVDSLPSGATGYSPVSSDVTTNGTGQASIAVTLGNRAGTYRIRATSAGLSGSPVLFHATATAGAAAVLAFGQQPTSAAAGAVISPAVTIEVLDGSGNLVTGGSHSIALNIGTNPSGGTLSGTTTATTSGGIATFGDLSIDHAGNGYTLRASSTGLTSALSGSFNITAGAASTLALTSGNNQVAAVSTLLPAPFVVTVTDNEGNPVQGVAVTFAVDSMPPASTGATLSAASATTNSEGQASSRLTLGNRPGVYIISASSSGLNGSPVRFAATATVGTASSITVETASDGSGTPVAAQNLQAGVPLHVYAVTRDAGGNFIANVQATWSLINMTGGVVAGDLIPAGNNRSAFFTGHIVGTAQISAVGAVAAVPSGTITVVPGPAIRVRVETLSDGSGTLVPAQTLASGTTLTVYEVTRDAFGNIVPNAGALWSLVGTTGNIVASDLAPSPDGRSATFTARRSGTTRIAAVSGLLDTTNTGIITVAAGSAVAMESASGDGQSGVAGTALAAPFAVRVVDANGNPVPGVGVTFALGTMPPGAAGTALSATNVTSDILGIARSTLILGTMTGNYTVTASSSGLTGSPVTFTATATPGVATQVRAESAPGGTGTLVGARSIASGTSLTVYAVARDANNNFVRDTSANVLTGWALEAITGSVQATDLVPSLDRRSATFTGHLLGSAVIRASVTGLTSVPTGVISVASGGAPAMIAVETAPNGLGTPVPAQTLASGDTLRVYAIFRDAAGNYLGNNPADGWLLKNVIGGLAAGDLVPSFDRRSALFTAHLVGSGIIAVVSGVLDTTNSGRITVTQGSVATVVARTGSSQSAVVGTAFDSTLAVLVRDLAGNPLRGITVRFAAPLSGASGTFSPGVSSVNVATDANGIAVAPVFSANTVVGTYTDTARIAGVPAPAYFRLTNRPAPANSITAVDGTPQTAQVGSAFAIHFAAAVRDQYGNPVPGLLVRFSPPTSGAGGSFTGGRDTARTDLNGVATAATFVADSIAGVYSVSANVPGLSIAPALFYLTNTAGPIGRIIAVEGDAQTTQVNRDYTVRFRVRVVDAADNPVRGVLVTFRAPVTPTTAPSGTFGSAATDTSRTDASGYAAASVFRANTHAGSFTLNATVDGTTTPAIFHLTNRPAALDTFLVEAAGGGVLGARVATEPFTIRVIALDIYGNTVTTFAGTVDVSANITLLQGGGTSRAFSDGVLDNDTLVLARSGNAAITVQRSGGTETGRSATFSVSNPVPRVFSVSPTNARAGETVNVIIRGSGFIGGVTTVTFGDRISTTTTVDSTTRLSVNMRIDATAPAGPRNVTVINAPPGGGTGIQVNGFTIGDNPVPTLTSLQPAGGVQGETLNVILYGTNFLGGVSTVDFGSGITVNSTIVDSSTRMTAAIAIDANAPPAARNVRVTNGPPGGGASNALTFTVSASPFAPPVPVTPLDSAVNQPTVVTLRWRRANAAQLYWLQVARDSSWNSAALVVNDSLITDTLRQVGPLTESSLYYWRARVLYNGGRSSWSAPWRFATGASSYPSTITVAATVPFPAHESAGDFQASDYRIVGLPGASDTAVSALVAGVPGTDWQMYWDNGETANYMKEYSSADTVFRFSAGKAFWLIKKGDWSVTATVHSAVPDLNENVSIPLHPGWNLITNPHREPIDWSAVQGANNNVPQPIWGYQGAFTRPMIFSSDSCAGYYFLNDSNLSTLKVPRVAGPIRKAIAADTSGWRVVVTLGWDDHIDRTTEIGVSPQASEGLDRLDIRKPHAPGAVPGIFFSHPEWDPVFSSFASDIRPGVDSLERWDISITSPPRKMLRLGFEAVEHIPAEFDAQLIDAERGRVVDLRKLGSSQYGFTPAVGLTKIRLVVGPHDAVSQESSDILPKEFALGQNFPNPFNPSTTIPVEIPRTAHVSVIVYSVLGQEVVTLQDGVLEPGRYWFTWRGNNTRGSSVATGVYVVRLATDTGVQFSRKMLLLK